MPDDSAILQVKLRRNDYDTSGEEFILKADKVDRAMSNNLVIKSILSAAGDIAGKDVNLGTESYTINGYIQNTDDDTYPTYTSIDRTQWAAATEKEMNLAQATRIWGPDVDDGFDELIWGPRTRTGMLSQYSTTENPAQKAPEQYSFTIEWTHTNVVI